VAKEKAEPEKQEAPMTRPTDKEVFLTLPSASQKTKKFGNFFIGTSKVADEIAAVEERRFSVLSCIRILLLIKFQILLQGRLQNTVNIFRIDSNKNHLGWSASEF
jgi:hypothetical protein